MKIKANTRKFKNQSNLFDTKKKKNVENVKVKCNKKLTIL